MGRPRSFFFILVFLSFAASFSFSAEKYKVITKSTGKTVEGRLLSETPTVIYLEVDGIQIQFKKDLLDLEKMKELNANYKSEEKTAAKTHEMKSLTITNATKKEEPQVDLGRLAAENQKRKEKSLAEFEARQKSKKTNSDTEKKPAQAPVSASLDNNISTNFGAFLWKADAPAGAVYLLGSVHAVTKAVYPLPESMEKAFLEANTVAVEVDILQENPNYDPVEIFESYMDTALYPQGETLQKHISKETYRLLIKEFDRYGVDLFELQRIRPWALAGLLSGFETEKAQLDPELGIDRHFLSRAKFRDKRIFELESIEFQAKLFGGFSDTEQEMYLLATLKDISNEFTKMNSMLSAWRAGDVKTLERIINESYPAHSELGAFRRKILTERNKGMLQKIEFLMQEKGIDLVIVGAAHLLGDDGLVTLMRNKGYKLERQ
jgi:uncharacterized protein YbaP (TraB family)